MQDSHNNTNHADQQDQEVLCDGDNNDAQTDSALCMIQDQFEDFLGSVNGILYECYELCGGFAQEYCDITHEGEEMLAAAQQEVAYYEELVETAMEHCTRLSNEVARAVSSDEIEYSNSHKVGGIAERRNGGDLEETFQFLQTDNYCSNLREEAFNMLMRGRRPFFLCVRGISSVTKRNFCSNMTIHSTSHPPIKHPAVKVPKTMDDFNALYKYSVENPTSFWNEEASKRISWFQPYYEVMGGSFIDGDIRFFAGGKLNACYNCIDRHLPTRANQTALIWETDEPGPGKSYTYEQMSQEICRIANVMKAHGIKRGDVVTIYMSMTPAIVMTMLACARIGAVHSVVFGGFSAEALRDRINDCQSNFVFTSTEGVRGGKIIKLKQTVDAAVAKCEQVKHVFVYARDGIEVDAGSLTPSRDVLMNTELPKARPYCPIETMDAEDTLFILYTSGSTGKPKGVSHSTAGYLLNASLTTSWSFDLQDQDVFCCVADCGWITGHTYVVYGPLMNGSTTVIFESVPTYPNPYRYWELVQRHRVTQFYTAPTAIRTLMKFDAAPIASYDLSSLRVLGSVGEPINPEAWEWYFKHPGKEQCSVVDTYWQTETGAHVGTNVPGIMNMKPGSCARPALGVQFAVLDPSTGTEITTPAAEGVLCIKHILPSVARTVRGDHERDLNIYMRPYRGYYFTGDGCRRDEDGYYWITGRVDDVLNTSGHRIGTAEIESALTEVEDVSEAACVGFPHDVKGEGIACVVILKDGVEPSPELTQAMKQSVRGAIGAFATPDLMIYCDLPKTRSGKIMRRILRKIAAGEESAIGDTTTLADPAVVERLIERFREAKTK